MAIDSPVWPHNEKTVNLWGKGWRRRKAELDRGEFPPRLAQHLHRRG